jgi:hypothetical protein
MIELPQPECTVGNYTCCYRQHIVSSVVSPSQHKVVADANLSRQVSGLIKMISFAVSCKHKCQST